MIRRLLLLTFVCVTAFAQDDVWTHEKTSPLPTDMMGPFIRLDDGAILVVEGNTVCRSEDEGTTWATWPFPIDESEFKVSNERALICTQEGTVILACMNLAERVWKWNSEIHDADPGTTLPTYAVRSLDGGKTWETPIKLHDEWSGCVRNMIQTRDGRVVFTAMRLLNRPGRHSVLSYSSTDEGASWKPSNVIDLGGNGHHGGATEATAIELEDGRLWKLIRTNLGTFWQAFSTDGIYWREMGPTDIAASSSPGQLLRLASGRVILAWNRPIPEGETEFPLRGGDNEWSEVPVSNHRGELSIAVTEDEGKTWSDPVVIARKPGASLAYPYFFERVSGELWITTMQGGVRLKVNEADFVD